MSRAIGEATVSARTTGGGVVMRVNAPLPEGWALYDEQGNPWPGPFNRSGEEPANAELYRADVEQLREACDDFLAGRPL